jgi:transcriptional regulator with XRE-family HTH domain
VPERFSQVCLAETLGILKAERKLSYRQLESMSKLSSGHWNHMVKGSRANPSDVTIFRVAQTLKVNPDFFLEWRVRRVAEELLEDPKLCDRLYVELCEGEK